MNRKIFLAVIIALLLFAGIIAVTQEKEIFFSAGELPGKTPDWVKPLRWFRSNQGGMAVEEAASSLTALRNEYALSIHFTYKSELPQNLVSFYNDGYYIEVRTLYEKGVAVRKQWLFRETNGTTRLNAVIPEPSQADRNYQDRSDNENAKEKRRAGFIEIFDENYSLISEYNFFDDGENSRTDYKYKDGILISTVASLWEEGEYKENYGDFFRYNRSSFLRAVERVFYRDGQISLAYEPIKVSFPRNTTDAAMPDNLTVEIINAYPEFFGEVHIERNNKIVYTTDGRGRILTQTLYDEDGDNIVWVIQNLWLNDRIISTKKTEGDTEYLAEYEYNSGGDRIIERNFKNGVLERLVRTEGKTEIEELYLNNVVVLRAVWEDGRKISETRAGIR